MAVHAVTWLQATLMVRARHPNVLSFYGIIMPPETAIVMVRAKLPAVPLEFHGAASYGCDVCGVPATCCVPATLLA